MRKSTHEFTEPPPISQMCGVKLSQMKKRKSEKESISESRLLSNKSSTPRRRLRPCSKKFQNGKEVA